MTYFRITRTTRGKYRSLGRDEVRETKFGELVTPGRTLRWGAYFSPLVGFSIHGREMANVSPNYFVEEATRKDHPYAPFVVPKLQWKPWVAPLDSRNRSSKYYRESIAHKAKEASHQISLQAWILYTIRFIFAGDLADSWAAFGGISSQFPP